MPATGSEPNLGPAQREYLVHGSTFDGSPCQIALSDTTLGHGFLARICKGRMLGTIPRVVALKVFPALLDPVTEALLSRELGSARKVSLRHPRILRFLGTANVGGRTAIVSLYMDNGNLMEYIRAHPECNKKRLIVQVAEAVDYLHGTARLVHGDLKCANVLISDLGNALLADFDLSTFAEKSESATSTLTAIRQMYTLRFAAPELLLGEGTTTLSKTCQSDVYAFGMLVLEALSERVPWENESNLSIMRKVCSGEHPSRRTPAGTFVTVSHSWWNTCKACWRFQSHRRPRIGHVLNSLMATDPEPYREMHFQERLTSVAYMPDGDTIVAGSSGGSVVLFDMNTGHIRRLWHGSSGYDMAVAISRDGLRITSSAHNTIRVWDAVTDSVLISIEDDRDLTCVASSPDGARIASAGTDCAIQLWDAVTGAAIGRRLEGHLLRVTGLSFSADGTVLASGSTDGTIRLWNSMSGDPLATLERSDKVDWVSAIRFTTDDKHLISGCDDGIIIVWDLRRKIPVHIHKENFGHVSSIVASSSGKHFASASGYHVIRVWDAQSSKQIGAPLIRDMGLVYAMDFSPDGRSLVWTSNDRIVRVWDLFD